MSRMGSLVAEALRAAIPPPRAEEAMSEKSGRELFEAGNYTEARRRAEEEAARATLAAVAAERIAESSRAVEQARADVVRAARAAERAHAAPEFGEPVGR